MLSFNPHNGWGPQKIDHDEISSICFNFFMNYALVGTLVWVCMYVVCVCVYCACMYVYVYVCLQLCFDFFVKHALVGTVV